MKTRNQHAWFWLVALMLLLVTGCGGGGGTDVDGDLDSAPDGDTDGDDPDGDTDGDDPDGDSDGDAEGEEPPDVEELVEQGYFWLENGEAAFAADIFAEAFAVVPDDQRVRFGYALSESMVGFELLFDVALGAMAGQLSSKPVEMGPDGPVWKDGDDSLNEWFDETLQQVFSLINNQFLFAVELYAPLKETGGVSITVNKIPFYLAMQHESWIQGEIDDADVYMFDGIARLMAGLFEFLQAHGLETDLGTAISVGAELVKGDANLQSILGLVTFLLNANDGFLDFNAEGSARIANSRALLVGALDDLLLAAAAAEAELETDRDQSDDIFVVEDDDGISMRMNLWSWETDDESGEPVADLTELTLIEPSVLVAASEVKAQIENGGDALPFSTHYIPLVSAAAIVPIGFGLLEAFGVDLGLDIAIVSPSVLAGLIGTFVNLDVVALDLNAYYADPVPLRDMLPEWTTDRGTWDNMLIMEWECPAELDDDVPDGAGGLLCAGGDETLVDAEHFKDTPYEIPLDDKLLGTPYIAFRDPTFGGMLYVDVEALDLDGYDDDARWVPADQFNLNAALGKILARIGSLIGD